MPMRKRRALRAFLTGKKMLMSNDYNVPQHYTTDNIDDYNDFRIMNGLSQD